MTELTDQQLLTAYAHRRDEQAFAQLVRRHVHLVHAAALRQTRDPHLADDVTQAVFMVLSRRASSIGDGAVVTGWLIKTTRYASMNALKLNSRRRFHETKAAAMALTIQPPSTSVEPPVQLDAVLDEALSRLGATDRSAIALRYLQGKRVEEVGTALGVSTHAAQKRILRALEKLRGIFARRGITAPTDALALSIAAYAGHVAPPALVTALSVQTAPTVSLIAKATLAKLALAQMKLAATCCAAFVIVAGAAATFLADNEPAARAAAPASQPAATTAPSTNVVTLPNVTFFQNWNPAFTTGLDDTVKRGSDAAVVLQSDTKEWGISGGAFRGVDATPFLGKRVRFSAYVKSNRLANWGGLWLFTAGADERIYASDDMGGRPVTGTSDWKKLEIVAEVPMEVLTIRCGMKLLGAGQLYMDGAQIEEVGKDVPITDDQQFHKWSFSSPKYTVGPDPLTLRNGKPTIKISATTPGTGEWCAWDHNDRYPEKMLGKRLKMSCWIKTENVTGPSGLLIRAQAGNFKYLGEDDKSQRKIKGTTPWTKYELTVAIPDEATNVISGIRMGGRGKLWVDDFQFEVLDPAPAK